MRKTNGGKVRKKLLRKDINVIDIYKFSETFVFFRTKLKFYFRYTNSEEVLGYENNDMKIVRNVFNKKSL